MNMLFKEHLGGKTELMGLMSLDVSIKFVKFRRCCSEVKILMKILISHIVNMCYIFMGIINGLCVVLIFSKVNLIA